MHNLRKYDLGAAFTFFILPATPIVSAVTIYGQIPLAQTNTAYAASSTTLAAYNETILTPPTISNPPPTSHYTVNLVRDANTVSGLSIPHVGPSFWGFSIEMSVVSQVLGKNSTHLAPTFLNLMSNLQERAGGILIRIGGNTQEFAVMVDKLDNGRTFGKTVSGSNATTKTPAVLYTRDMFYMAFNISSLVNVKWFFGIPFNDSMNWRLTIAEEAQDILGDNLVALQAGNEPDFYLSFGRRQIKYDPADYNSDVDSLIKVIDANPRIPVKNKLLGPSVATGPWTPEMVWETGFIDRFKDRLYALTVEHYPDNNCAAQFNTGSPAVPPQSVFPAYLNHKDRVVDLVAPYVNSGNLAQQAGKPFIMFETNSASCGGFAGISDTFGAALWAADYGFQMAFANFTHAMMHIGGQNVFYNPFTSPPTNQSSYHQWTVGAVYYSTLILAEAFATTNTSRIIDLQANAGNIYTPSYAIYENDVLDKVALFNYVDDPTGANDLQVTLDLGSATPASVRVKYLAASTVSIKDNMTWAGQTLGNTFEVDGRFRGTLDIHTIPCSPLPGECVIPVKAPGFALAFLDAATSDSADMSGLSQATKTFSTTAWTNIHNTATFNPQEVETSNGHAGPNRGGGHDGRLGTSSFKGSKMTNGSKSVRTSAFPR
ncbi:glycoside hydrolase family 79 protein [Crepidotus variabilis]|uniref:Glycoside hydrolase family 79 protein n=1 Tax=Crepidotus variabilis TaxID=179855 RepID=A0A9P6EJB8_9AGAR|nr:glycoside hydrolase family 79 protein [Crepidotus variabilis]